MRKCGRRKESCERFVISVGIHTIHQSGKHVFAERMRINPCEKSQDPAGIRTQDLMNTSQCTYH